MTIFQPPMPVKLILVYSGEVFFLFFLFTGKLALGPRFVTGQLALARPSKCLNHHNQRMCKNFLAGVNLLLLTYIVLL